MTPEVFKAKAKCDGSGNSPRGSTCAAVIFDEDGQIIHERSRQLPDGSSNNVAEYSGVILAIEVALELEVDELEIFSDSQLIVNQINGKWRVKDAKLLPYRETAWELASSLSSVKLSWIPREENTRADHLCRVLLNEYCPK